MGNPYGKRRVIIVKYVFRSCGFVVVRLCCIVFICIIVDINNVVLDVYYFVIVDINVNFDGIV